MAPVEFSAEWNATCALRPATERNSSNVASAYTQFNWFVIAFVASYYPLFTVAFWYFRRQGTSAYLTKRSFAAVLLAALGCFSILIVGPIRDLVGREVFSCSLTLWFRILGVINVIYPVLLRLNFFRTQMLWSKAMKSISFQKLQEMINDENNENMAGQPSTNTRKSLFSVTNVISTRDSAKRIASTIDEAAKSENSSQASDGTKRHGMSSGYPGTASSAIGSSQFNQLVYMQSVRYQVITLVIPILPLIICGFALEFGIPYYVAGCAGCYEELWFFLVIMALVGFLITGVGYFAFLLRKSPDPLGMLYEIKWLVISASAPGGLGCVLTAVDQYIGRIYDHGIFSWDWLVILALIIEFFWLCVHPLFVSMSMSRKVSGIQVDFKSFLANPRAVRLFSEHLANEWAIENLKFWSQVETFRGQHASFKTTREANIVAWQTYCTFIRAGAVLDINIGSVTRDRLVTAFEEYKRSDPTLAETKIPGSIFDEAQHEVFNLMEKDTFQRFLKTPAYKGFAGDNTILDANTHRLVVVNDANGA